MVELEEKLDNNSYVIYCANNHNKLYMDYRGEPVPFSRATIFKDVYEAHKFLREHTEVDSIFYWVVLNIKESEEVL